MFNGERLLCLFISSSLWLSLSHGDNAILFQEFSPTTTRSQFIKVALMGFKVALINVQISKLQFLVLIIMISRLTCY